jgi:hypothetical protein
VEISSAGLRVASPLAGEVARSAEGGVFCSRPRRLEIPVDRIHDLGEVFVNISDREAKYSKALAFEICGLSSV